jgi:MarR family transcriptional regulator, 2-MHQ and catechol-resistance regulon repressor
MAKIRVMTSCDDARIHAFGVTLEALTRLNHLFDRSLKDSVGLGQGWFEALLRIERSGGHMTMGELADQVALTSGGVTRLVDRLVEVGYAERRNCATDRRVQYVAITEAGRHALEQAIEVHLADLQREYIDRITPEELEVIVRVMDRLRTPVTADATA